MKEDLTIRSFEGMAGLDEITEDWRAVSRRGREMGYFHEIEWFRCFAESLADDPEALICYVIYRNEAAIAVFPFESRRRRILGVFRNRILGFPDHPHVDFGDFTIAEEADIAPCVAALFEEMTNGSLTGWDSVVFPRFLGNSSVAAAMRSSLPKNLHATVRYAEPCSYLPLTSYEEIIQSLSVKARSNLNRTKRQALQLDGFEYRCVTEFPELKKAFEEFLELEASGWKGADGKGTAIKMDARLVSYYRSLLERFSPGGRSVIHVLRQGDRPICAAFGIVSNKTYYGLKMGYDEGFRKLSPGHLLQEFIIKEYEGSGAVKCSNFVASAPWLQMWKPREFETFELTLFRTNARGRLLFVFRNLWNGMRSLKKKLEERYFVKERGKLRLRAIVKSKKSG